MTNPPRLVAFDLDDTLAPSKSPLPQPITDLLTTLLTRVPVCIISGGQFEQFDKQVIARLADGPQLERLHLMPTNGTRYDTYSDGRWRVQYKHDLPRDLRDRALAVLEEQAKRLGLWESQTWGPILEDRGSQITFSALGQAAPVDAKKAWDPDGSKRAGLQAAVAPHLPELDVHAGGSTSIDITSKGIDKAYGISRLAQMLGLEFDEILFVGDRLEPGGNDFPVKALGVATHQVTGWEDTLTYVTDLLPRLDS
ncbi:MAG TPA: HAD-IIB family hydrolase [Propioniciclava tarda]|nr:HAD-IIB family hydrolase [Propioniciclava tarda]HQD61683.1 HAD-IIB family hydrolase [Propioniciclava tarda]